MSRYLGPRVKLLKKYGLLPNLNNKKLKSIKESNLKSKSKVGSYKLRLQEIQKLKYNYDITEKQLFNIVKKARKCSGITSLIILQMLETRIDTLVLALGFSLTLMQARQIVNHGHILVNRKCVNRANFQCNLNDLISVKTKHVSTKLIKLLRSLNLQKKIPEHLKLNKKLLQGTVLNYCKRQNVKLDINELLIIEYYSRR